MIQDIGELSDGAELRAAVGLIGAGFAGIELARRLGGQGVSVVLLESGREAFDPRTQQLARYHSVGKPMRSPDPDGPFTPYLPAEFRGECRLRQFGGTSNIWTGKWRMFDDLDFAERPWVPGSGWPINGHDLAPYYRQVTEAYQLGDADAFERQPQLSEARRQLAEAGLGLGYHYWEQTAARPATRFRDELASLASLRVVLGANATELRLDPTHQRVESVVCRSLDGRAITLHADRFVLCMGGLEPARLLLASNKQLPAGVGNAHGLVGRYHQDHPKSKKARLYPGPAIALIDRWTRVEPRPCFHVNLSMSEAMQAEHGLLHHAVYLKPVFEYLVDYPERAMDQVRSGRPLAALAGLAKLLASPSSIGKVLRRRRHRDRSGQVDHYIASMYVEQAPNAESRLKIADDTDALGMPRLVIDWQLSDLDYDSFAKLKPRLIEAFEHAGLGRLDFGDPPLTLDEMVDAAHHMGATRMARTPDRGVVDPQCRVFDTENLYIASGSVFPTGHSAAPTMTILALACRLADHLLALGRDEKRPIPHASG